MVMWNHYRCDRCGRIIYVDTGDIRLCDKCLEALQKGDGGNEVRKESGDHDGGDPGGDRWCYFPVERVQEGFAFWNSGGFNTRGNIGRSAVAAGLEGERLKLVRYKSEYNGKHSLAVVYPGCFLAVSVANNTLESDNTMVYQVLGFIRQENEYQAKCKKVFQMEPKRSLLTEGQEERLERIIGVANRIAVSPNLRRLGNWV